MDKMIDRPMMLTLIDLSFFYDEYGRDSRNFAISSVGCQHHRREYVSNAALDSQYEQTSHRVLLTPPHQPRAIRICQVACSFPHGL